MIKNDITKVMPFQEWRLSLVSWHSPFFAAATMKINLPVTNQEIPFPPNQYLVSKTDLKGIITHANDAFVEISGFSRDELIGASHNWCAIRTCRPRPLPTCGAR